MGVDGEDHQTTELDMDKIPEHVAIIMDGNGRWATRQHLPRVATRREWSP